MFKRVLLIVLILTFFTALSFSQSIKITNPRSGVSWENGKTYIIEWNKSGSMNTNVKIRLYQGNVKILSIINSTPNNGKYEWKIPENIAEGTYKIRVKTIDNTVYDDSDVFIIGEVKTIIHEQKVPNIKIKEPVSGASLTSGSLYAIKWNSKYLSGGVIIGLYKNGVLKGEIYNGTNIKRYIWKIGNYTNGTPVDSGDYKLRVSSKEKSSVYDEVSITIKENPQKNCRLNITNPPDNEIIKIGKEESFYIKWNHSGCKKDYVVLKIFKLSSQKCDSSLVYPPVLDTSVANNGNYYYKIPSSFDEKLLYRVKIEIGNVSDISNCLRIRASNEFSSYIVEKLKNLTFSGGEGNCNTDRNKCLAINVENLISVAGNSKFKSEMGKTKADIVVYLYKNGVNVKSLGTLDKSRGFIPESKLRTKDANNLLLKFKKNADLNINQFEVVFTNPARRRRIATCKIKSNQQMLYIVNFYNQPQNIIFFNDPGNNNQNSNIIFSGNNNNTQNSVLIFSDSVSETVKKKLNSNRWNIYGEFITFSLNNLQTYRDCLSVDMYGLKKIIDNKFKESFNKNIKIEFYLYKRNSKIVKLGEIYGDANVRYNSSLWKKGSDILVIKLGNYYEKNDKIYSVRFFNSKKGNKIAHKELKIKNFLL